MIVVSGATQFEKMTIWSKKDIFIDYLNNDWYIDIYHYYINHQFLLLVDRTQYTLIKRQAQYH